MPVASRVLLALWVLIVAAIAVYLVAGTARVGAGFWIGRRMPVRVIWADFLGWLADQGASPLLVSAIVATAVDLPGFDGGSVVACVHPPRCAVARRP